MKLKLTILILLITLPKIILALDENDFAYIAETQTTKDTPYYELEIPTIVYESITRTDLGDLRVLNGDGHVVPHGLRATAVKRSQKTESKTVPLFPLYQHAGQTRSDLQLNIKRNNKGDIININSRRADDIQTGRLSGYLLDLREWKKPVQQLKINWGKMERSSFIKKLTIYKSENLEHWRLVARGKTLVNMAYQNHQLIENTLSLSTNKTNYLRLVFEDKKSDLEIESVEVIHTQSSQKKRENWKAVSLKPTKTSGEYSFQHHLKSLTRQIKITLPENNTVVSVKVLSRLNKEQPWHYRGSSLLYRLSVNGTDIEKTNINISRSRDTQWLLRFDQQGGGIGSGLPLVKLAWQPQQLVFVARGNPPYRVVWGSTQVKPVTINANQLLPAINNITNANMISPAQILPDTKRTINTQALQPKSKEVNWQQWILWIVLVSAAALLIWMAIRLMKKMAE